MVDEQLLPTREEIVDALQRDREEALAKYFSIVQSRLKRIVNFRLDYRLSGRVSESDVIQETYVRAAKRIDSFLDKEDMPFFVWLRLEVNQKLHEIHRHHFGAEKRDIRKEIKLGQANESGKTSMALAAHIVAQLTSPSRLIERAEQISILEKNSEGLVFKTITSDPKVLPPNFFVSKTQKLNIFFQKVTRIRFTK